MVCIVQEFSDAKNSTVRIFSLAYPPVMALPPDMPSRSFPWTWVLVAGLVLLGLVIYLVRRKKIKKVIAQIKDEPAPEEMAIPHVFETLIEEPMPEIRQNAVYMLGPLTVYDKKGTDITHLFSPKIRLLFTLILMKSQKGGITSREISLALWPDKEPTKTKNIRGVNINHLRNVLSDLDGIKLVFINDSYTFEIDDRVFCDYLALMQEVKSPTGKWITQLYTRGNLVSDYEDPSLDSFRQAYEEEVLPVILHQLRKLYQLNDFKTAYKLTGAILDMDPFNEIAIQYQLAVLRRWKGGDAARKKYDFFAANYEKSLGISYGIPFEKIPLPETDPPAH